MTLPRLTLCCLLAALVAGVAFAASAAEDRTLLRAREGASALMRGQYDKAIAFYDEALQTPEIADFIEASLYSDRGVAKWRLKQTKEAIEDFNKSIQLSAENANVYNNRGNALMDLGHPAEAVKDFDRAIALSPNYGAAHNNRGNARAALGQYEPAFQDFRKAVELMPQSPVPFNGRGKAHAALKRYHAAVRDFTRAIGLDARYAAAYHNRAEAYLALEKYREATEDATQALDLLGEQPSPDLLLLRGQAHAGDKRFNQALEDLDRATELKPDLADAYMERGVVSLQTRRFEDAIADFSRVIEIDRNAVRAYAMRASARLQAEPPPPPKPAVVPEVIAETGEAGAELIQAEPAPEPLPQPLDQALNDVNQALQIAPDDPLAHRVKGDIFQALERIDDALAEYRMALAQDPFQPESRKALEGLDQEVPPVQQAGVPLDAPVEGWIITEPAPGRYIASNPKYASLQAELEMFGTGRPKILEWKLMRDALAGIGLLKYYAGDFGGGQETNVEYVAIVDTRANKVVSIEPHAWGQATAQWNWQAVSVVVTDPDGNANEIQLRRVRARPGPVARDDSWGFEQPVARSDRGGRRAARRGGGGGAAPGGGGGGGMFNWLFR